MPRPSKGPLIQKMFFLIFIYSKATTKFFTNFCLSLQKVVETKNKRTLWYKLVIRVYLTQRPFFFDSNTLRGKGRNLLKKIIGFSEYLKARKNSSDIIWPLGPNWFWILQKYFAQNCAKSKTKLIPFIIWVGKL